MQPSGVPWPPRVGDIVVIKGGRQLGTVLAIEGSEDDQLFILGVHAPDSTAPNVAVSMVVSAPRTPAAYWLDDLAPACHP